MVGALFVNIFDAEVVDHERKTDIQCRVLPKGSSASNSSITELFDIRSDAFIGNVAGLFETGHALSDIEVYPTVRASKALKAVLVDNFGWKDVEGELHILEMRHMSVVVEVLDLKGKEAYIGCGQGNVDQYV